MHEFPLDTSVFSSLLPVALQNALHFVVLSPESIQSRRIYMLDMKFLLQWMQEHYISYSTFSEKDALAYKQALQERYEKATAQRMLSVAKLLFTRLHHTGELSFNPFADVKAFKLENESTHRALSRDQALRLFSFLDISTPKGLRDAVILTLLLRTGLRRSECVELNIGDFAVEQGHHVLYVRHGKGDKRRIVKVPTDVFRLIEKYLSVRVYSSLEDPLFISFDHRPSYAQQRISSKTIERLVREYGRKIGFDDTYPLTPHDLRATFITLSLENGAILQQTQAAAGHADARTTWRYFLRKTNLDDNAVDKLSFLSQNFEE